MGGIAPRARQQIHFHASRNLEQEELMEKKPILVVDDEKNIRLTMSQALEPLGVPVETAVNGEEALQKINRGDYGLMFLDLKMPGMSGMEVLRKVRDDRSEIRVIIITAHGTIETAVEAMKLGAADFIQKPFSPGEVRDLAIQVQAREELDKESAADYRSLIEGAKRYISDRNFSGAREMVRKAIAADPSQSEAYNLMGVLSEIKDDLIEARKFYRAALDIDSTYKPAWSNLERITSTNRVGNIDLGHRKASDTGEEDRDEK